MFHLFQPAPVARMPKALLACVFMLAFFHFPLAGQQYIWMNDEGGPNFVEFGLDAAVDDSGNVYMVGSFEDNCDFGGQIQTSQGLNDGFLAKYNPDGQLLWMVPLASSVPDRLIKVNTDWPGRIYVSGYGKPNFPNKTRHPNRFGNSSEPSPPLREEQDRMGAELHSRDALYAEFRPDGKLKWGFATDGNNFGEGKGIVADTAGNSFGAGIYNTQAYFPNDTLLGRGSTDSYVISFDSNGTIRWIKDMGGPGDDELTAIGRDQAGNLYVGGTMDTRIYIGNDSIVGTNAKDAFVAKLDPGGNFIWGKALPGQGDSKVMDLQVTPAGNLYFAGIFTDSITLDGQGLKSASFYDFFYARINPSGQVAWLRSGSGSNLEFVEGVTLDAEENFYTGGYFYGTLLIGNTADTSKGADDLFFMKADSSGNLEWVETNNYSLGRGVFGLDVDRAGSVFLTGNFVDSLVLGPHAVKSVDGTADIYIAKYSQVQQLTLDSLIGQPTCINDQFVVYYTMEGHVDAANVFYLELSDASGSFASPDTIGSRSGLYSDKIIGTIPASVSAGTGYRVRVVSSSPVLTSNDNGFDLQLTLQTSLPVSISGDTTLCQGDTLTLSVATGFVRYDWSTGDTTASIQITAIGTYSVEATDSGGCRNRDEITIIPCIAIEPGLLSLPPEIWPNPSTGDLNLHLQDAQAGKLSLSLLDLTGRRTWHRTLYKRPGPQQFLLNLQDQPAGLYLLEIRSETHQVVKKLILR